MREFRTAARPRLMWLVTAALPLAASAGGCASRAELIALREGMDRSTTTIRKQHLEWAQLLSEGKQSQLPPFSAADYRAVRTAHQEYQGLVDASRSDDSGGAKSTAARATSTRP